MRPLKLMSMAAALMLAAANPCWSADDAELTAQVEALRAAIAEQRAALDAQAKLLEAQQVQLEALTKQLGQSKIGTQEAPRLTFSNNRPTITAADGRSSIAFRANVQLDGALYGESPEGALDHRFPSRLGRWLGQPRKQCRPRFLRRLLFPARTIRRRGDHRPRLQLPPVARARRFRHRRPDAHQRCLDRLHRLRAFHVPVRRVLAARQHGRRHHARRSGLPRARQRRGIVAYAGRRRRPHRPWRQGERRALDELTRAHHAHRQRCRSVRHAALRCGARGLSSLRPAPTTTCMSARRERMCSHPPTRDPGSAAAARAALARPAGDPRRQHAPHRHRLHRRRPRQCYTASNSARTGRTGTCRAKTSGSTSSVHARGAARSDFAGYYVQGSWISHRRKPSLQRRHGLVPESAADGAVLGATAASAPGNSRRATAA